MTKRIYKGTDGKTYKGKAVKARKWLEARQKQYYKIINKPGFSYPQAYTLPGSMKCSRNQEE